MIERMAPGEAGDSQAHHTLTTPGWPAHGLSDDFHGQEAAHCMDLDSASHRNDGKQ